MKKAKRIVSLLLIVVMVLLVTACTAKKDSKGREEEDTASTRLIKVGYAQCGSESAWREANTASIQQYCTPENGIDLHFENAEGDIDKQREAVRSFIAEGVDVIGLAPLVEDGWEEVLTEAKEAGIPVILVDRTISSKDESLYTCWIGADFLLEGYKAADWLIDYMAEQGEQGRINVAVLEGTTGAGATIGRTEGVNEMLESESKYRIIFSETGDFSYDGGKETFTKCLREHRNNIDVLISQNDDMTLAAIDVMEENGIKPGKDIVIISFDGVHAAFEAMVEGKINCTVECNPLSGKAFVDTAKKIMNDETVEKKVYVQEDIYPADTAADYIDSRKY